VEKGSTVGAHILSGAVVDPIGLDRLTPEWRSDPECPLKTQVAIDQFYYLTETRAAPLPNWAMPKLMSNHGNFIGSLGAVARWLSARAEALGVEIYPGFAATELLYGDLIRGTFAGGKRIAYGARVMASGGWQSAPKLVFPGGALIGCSAGFVNFARIKGSHNAILSGMLAAEKTREALAAGRANDELSDYESSWRDSDIGRDLYKVRNVKPLWSRFGLVLGVGLGGFDM
jgi:flavin-dependent dehydrogenase